MIVYSLVLTLLLFGCIGCSKYGEPSNVTSVVSLSRLTVNAKIVPYCAGTVIHKQQVLTAAHCVVDVNDNIDLKGIFVLSGSSDLRYSVKNKVKSGLIHPNYTHSGLTDDVAILVIEGFFQDWIKPMKLVRIDRMKDNILQCMKIEWAGNKYLMNDKKSAEKFYVHNITEKEETAIISRSKFDCGDYCIQKSRGIRVSYLKYHNPQELIFSNDYTMVQDERQLLGWQYDNPENYRETGGPVMCYGVQYGIVSWVDVYSPQVPTLSVSSSVFFYIDWIEKSSMYLDHKEKSPTKITIPTEIPTNDERSTVVAIYRLTEGGKFVPYCGGTIIDRQIVLTAASCLTNDVDKDKTELFVMSGTTDLRFGLIHKVIRVRRLRYDRRTHENDLAMILVDIPFAEGIVPMKRADRTDDNPSLNSSCIIYGWGFKNQEEESMNFWDNMYTKVLPALKIDCGTRCLLQSASVNTVSHKDFGQIFGIVPNNVIQTGNKRFYTFTGIYVKCNDNFGSPIVCSGIQYGIVPRKPECGKTDEPVIITSVGFFSNWISNAKSHLTQEAGYGKME